MVRGVRGLCMPSRYGAVYAHVKRPAVAVQVGRVHDGAGYAQPQGRLHCWMRFRRGCAQVHDDGVVVYDHVAYGPVAVDHVADMAAYAGRADVLAGGAGTRQGAVADACDLYVLYVWERRCWDGWGCASGYSGRGRQDLERCRRRVRPADGRDGDGPVSGGADMPVARWDGLRIPAVWSHGRLEACQGCPVGAGYWRPPSRPATRKGRPSLRPMHAMRARAAGIASDAAFNEARQRVADAVGRLADSDVPRPVTTADP